MKLLKEESTTGVLVEVHPKRIFKLHMKAFWAGLLCLVLTEIPEGNTNEYRDTIRVYVNENVKHSEKRAGLRAKKGIYKRLIANSIVFSNATSPSLRKIITGIHYRNNIKRIRVTGFKKQYVKKVGDRLEYKYSYNKINLPKTKFSEVVKNVGFKLAQKQIKIEPIYVIELSLNFPKLIPFNLAMNAWTDKYSGFIKHAFDSSRIYETDFLKNLPVNIPESQMPNGLTELLMLNDVAPFNLKLCGALANKLDKIGLNKTLEKVLIFCLKSPRFNISTKGLDQLALRNDLEGHKKIDQNNDFWDKLQKEKKLISQEYFDIYKFNSLSYIINSLGQIPIVLKENGCKGKGKNIADIAKRFEGNHSAVDLKEISNWFLKHEFPFLHDVLVIQLKGSVVREKENRSCKINTKQQRKKYRNAPKIKDL
jgi:signal peptidase I